MHMFSMIATIVHSFRLIAKTVGGGSDYINLLEETDGRIDGCTDRHTGVKRNASLTIVTG